jgi:hypothetical protein
MSTTDIVESTARDVVRPGDAIQARQAMDHYERELRSVVKDSDWTTWESVDRRTGELLTSEG